MQFVLVIVSLCFHRIILCFTVENKCQCQCSPARLLTDEMNKETNDVYGTYGESGEGDYNIVEDTNPYYGAGD